MYYVKIPLRHLCRPEDLNVPEERRGEVWSKRVLSLMEDLREGIIPHWAIDFNDMKQLALIDDQEDNADAIR